MSVFFLILAILATLAGLVCTSTALHPLDAAFKGISPTVVELEAILFFLLAAISGATAALLARVQTLIETVRTTD